MGETDASELFPRLLARNEALRAHYRRVARAGCDRALSSHALVCAEQRESLAKDLEDLSGPFSFLLGPSVAGLAELPPPPAPTEAGCDDLLAVFTEFRDLEAADEALYHRLAAAAAGVPELAGRIEALATGARHRASLAEAHIDLLSLGGPARGRA